MTTKHQIEQVIKGIPETLRGPAKIAEIVSEFILKDGLFEAIRIEKRDEILRHKTRMAALENREKEVRGMCKHESRTYHPDPSGNNDSSWECIICGADVERPT